MPADNRTCSVGAIIVNHNAGLHLIDAIQSVKAEGVDRLIVVDNASTDDSVENAQQTAIDLELIKTTNGGFGAANNLAAEKLRTDYIWCVNPDAVVHAGALAALTTVLDSDPSVAAVGPLTLDPDGSQYPSARSFPVLSHAVGHAPFSLWWPNNSWTRAYKRLDSEPAERTEVDWVSGSSMLVRRTAFESVGGFDDSYFMYMEDVDLCWRLRKAGWKVVFEPSASVTHVGGVSTKGRPYKMLREHHRSAIRYNVKTTTGFHRLLLPVLIAGLMVRLPLAWLHQLRTTRRTQE